MKSADRYCIEKLCIPEIILMEHAALAIVDALILRFGDTLSKTKGLILAGSGNNGGDALAVARILFLSGNKNFRVVKLGKQISPSAEVQLKMLETLKAPIIKWEKGLDYDWMVDGLFGTGLSRVVEGESKEVIQAINNQSQNRWKIAIDIPSGLCSNTGNPMGLAIEASETVTLGFIKKGLVTAEAANYVGKLGLKPIQIPRDLPKEIKAGAFLFEKMDAKKHLPQRKLASHKGSYGHVYVWAGVRKTQGAAALSCIGALRSGCGLVSLIGHESLDEIRARLPKEVMTLKIEPSFFEKTKQATLAIGPGMGVEQDHWEILKQALAFEGSLVLDADAITLIATHKDEAMELLAKRKKQLTFFTPHPKEASRLLGNTAEEVQKDRYQACKAIIDAFGVHVILKGKGSIIGAPKKPLLVVREGDTSLAKGGTGDLLTGILAGLIAQNKNDAIAGLELAALASYLHGRAAELRSQRMGTERSAIAGEIADEIQSAFAELEA